MSSREVPEQRRGERRADRLRVAVDEAASICDPRWRLDGEQRMAIALGPELWAQARAADGLCEDVADLAGRLAQLSAEGDRATDRILTSRMLERLRHPGTSKLVTRALAVQTVPAPSTSTVLLVHAMRALGVLHCMLRADDAPHGPVRVLARCRCLWPLARHEHEHMIRNDVRMVVRFGLNRVPAAWLVPEPTG
ncbi:MAG: hypothetical protein AB7J32_08200 [Pseudonocardia sp.]